MEEPERLAKIVELKRQRIEDIDQRIARLTSLEESGINLHDLTDVSDTMLDPNDKRSDAIIALLEGLVEAGRSDAIEYVVLTATREVPLPGCTGFGAKQKYRREARVIIIEGDPIVESTRNDDGEVTFTVKGSVGTTVVGTQGVDNVEAEILINPLTFINLDNGTVGLVNYGRTPPLLHAASSRIDAMRRAVDAYMKTSTRCPIKELRIWSGIPELQPPTE